MIRYEQIEKRYQRYQGDTTRTRILNIIKELPMHEQSINRISRELAKLEGRKWGPSYVGRTIYHIRKLIEMGKIKKVIQKEGNREFHAFTFVDVNSKHSERIMDGESKYSDRGD